VSTNPASGPVLGGISLDIEGMTCASCATRVEKSLNTLPGVRAAVNYATERATIWGDAADIDQLIAQVEKSGYKAFPHDSAVEKIDPIHALIRRTVWSLALSAPIVALSMVPPIQFPYWQWVVLALALPVATWGAWPFHRSAWVNAKHRQANMDTLVSIGVGSALLWSLYALIFGGAGMPGMTMQMHLFSNPEMGGNEIYLEVAAAVTAFMLLGRYLETKAKRDAGKALQALVEAAPKTARVVREIPGPSGVVEVELEVPVDSLSVGDRFVVIAGESVATDGVIISGQSAMDQSIITGESAPVDVGPGMSVAGGAINTFGRILVEATRVGADTQLARMAVLVEQAQSGKAHAQRLADSISGVFVPVVLVLATVTLAGWWMFGPSIEGAFRAAVATLIIACPCALGLATPTALLAGTGRGAQLGILIAGPTALEASRHIDTVVFDKTGTLTTGQMSVAGVFFAEGVSDSEFRKTVWAVEKNSHHPIAKAIAKHCESAGDAPSVVTGLTETPGQGVRATVGGREVVIGRSGWLPDGVVIPEGLLENLAAAREKGHSTVVVAVDGVVWGVVSIADTVKPDTAHTIAALHRMGLRVVMCSGDSEAAANAIANSLGIDEVIADVSPEGKVEIISRLQAEGHRVAMVGDGINDAPALATANVGIALGAGTDQAIAASDITLTRGDVADVPVALRLSRKTLGTIRGNLFWAFAYNTLAIPAAMAGLLSPLLAGAAMAFSSVFVVTNSLRLTRFRATTTRRGRR
jgi:P-type Cu+ transporter